MKTSSKIFITIAVIAFTASALFAQAQPVRPRPANEVFLERGAGQLSSNQPTRTQWYTSNRFQLMYHSTDAPISESVARRALDQLEEIFDVYVYDNGFAHPWEGRPQNQRYKMLAYVITDGHAFGGVTGNPSGPGMWLSAGAVEDWWALAHEFMHGLQIQLGGLSGGSERNRNNFRGWFYESHANLKPHLGSPNEIHFCAEMFTRMPQAYLGSTRNRYCNWQFFEYVIHRDGVETINKLWEPAQSGADHDPFTELKVKATTPLSQRDLGDWLGDFAMKTVTWDLNTWSAFGETSVNQSTHFNSDYRNRGGRLHRGLYNSNRVNQRLRRARYTYLEELPDTPSGNNPNGNRYVVPFAAAPQRYGHNIIRLYPDSAGIVTVKFRGDVQTSNNIRNWSPSRTLHPAAANLPNNPASDWRYGLVAVTGDVTGTGAATPTYSVLRRAVGDDGELDQPDVSIQVAAGQQLFLVVAATPTVHHKITWDQLYESIYRFPYMIEVHGAKPEGFQHGEVPQDRRHANGGGFVASGANVSASAYVGPFARVTGGTVRGNARIEDRAIVANGTIEGNARVRGHAYIGGGTISGDAIIEENAHIWGGTITDNARVRGIAHVMLSGNGRVGGNAEIKDAPWIENVALNMSGTAKIYGDCETYGVTVTSGVFTGILDNGAATNSGNAHFGGNLTEFPVEVTRSRSLLWYGVDDDDGDDDDGDGDGDNDVVECEDDEELVDGECVATSVRYASSRNNTRPHFRLDNRGTLRYNLGGAQFATLQIFDVRGRLITSIRLDGRQNIVNTNLRTGSQVLFWRLETSDRAVSQGRMRMMSGR